MNPWHRIGPWLCVWVLPGCASLLGDVNPVLMAVLKEDANRVREAARMRETYDNGTPKIDATNVCGERALHLAIQKNNVEIAQILLQEGADPDLPSEAPREPSACATFSVIQTRVGFPPLHYAISTARPRIAQALLMAGADPMLTTPDGKNAAALAKGKAGLDKLVAYMESPLHLGAKTGNLGKVRAALRDGTDVNETLSGVGTTPLEEALVNRRWLVVDYLMEQGAGGQSTVSSKQVHAVLVEYLAEHPDTGHAEKLRALMRTSVR